MPPEAAEAVQTEPAAPLTLLEGAAPPASAPAQPQAPATPAADTGRPEGVPEKFWDAEKKAVRTDAVLESYRALEQRMRDGGAPPKAANDYTFERPEALKHVELDEERTADFRQFCHELGLTQKQYQGVMNRYLESIQDVGELAISYSQKECEASLRSVWKSDEDYKRNLALAYKASAAYLDEDLKGEMHRIGNNPALVRILAKIGAEMKEDRPPGGNAVLQGEDIVALMRNPAYRDEKHPEHLRIKAKVDAHFAAGGRHPSAPAPVNL